MGDADRRIGLVDMLAARTGSAVGVDTQIVGIDLDLLDFRQFRQYRYSGGGSVNAALCFRGWHPLHTMSAGFEFQARIGTVANDAADHLFVATVFAGAFAKDFQAPAAHFGIACVHAHQITREQRRLVATGPGTYFQKYIARVVRIAWQQQQLQFPRLFHAARFRLQQFLLGQGAQFGIAVLAHFAGTFQVVQNAAVAQKSECHRFQLGIFHRQGAKAFGITDDLRDS